MDQAPIFKHIVLVGGGHAHALVIRKWAMNPIPGIRITLISPQIHTPYSGMLPGLLAGHYDFDDTHIDLLRLCKFANVRFIQDQVIDIKAVQNRVILSQHPYIEYDQLSVDIGSTPDLSIPGAKEFAIPVKPISNFYNYWQKLEQDLASGGNQKLTIIGGGAGAIELALAAGYRFQKRIKTGQLALNLVYRNSELLSGYPARVKSQVKQALSEFKVSITNSFEVTEVNSEALVSTGKQTVTYDHLLWCTQASAQHWLKKTELPLNQQGFIRVNSFLQSPEFKNVFAAGDIAHMDHSPRPKAGVYAVRQGPYLFNNLISACLNKPLKQFKPQSGFLSLIALGDKKATGHKGKWSFTGSWVWNWKDNIDRKFMTMLNKLPELKMTHSDKSIPAPLLNLSDTHSELNPKKRCAACGAKVPASVLQEVLSEIYEEQYVSPEDAATIDVVGESLLQTVDQLKAPIDNPYLFGRMAAIHAMSDLYACNAKPTSAQAMLNLPFAGTSIQKQELRLLLAGILEEFNKAHVTLAGGHTSESLETSIGLVINGELTNQSFNKTGVQSGQVLVLTKPLGTGVLLAAHMQNKLSGHYWNSLFDSILLSNQQSAQHLSDIGVTVATDVTGFGLLGHLKEMLAQSGCRIDLDLDAIPVLPGAKEAIKDGIKSSLTLENLKSVQQLNINKEVFEWEYIHLLVDPQTSGGLLAAVDESQLNQINLNGFHVIGKIA